MTFEIEEIKIELVTDIVNFFNYWKKYWLIIVGCIASAAYGFHLLVTRNEVGSGLPAITISVAILGWLISARSADENLRRIKRVEYLSNAYEGIALYLRRDSSCPEYNTYLDGLEKSFTIIQLYGERKEMKLVCSIIEQYNLSNDRNIQCDALLNMLRDNLRKELLLPKAVKYVRTMRVERAQTPEVKNALVLDLMAS